MKHRQHSSDRPSSKNLVVFGFSDWSRRGDLLVLLTTLVGFYSAAPGLSSCPLMVATLIGTALLACGAAVLTNWPKKNTKRRMRRYRDTPLAFRQTSTRERFAFWRRLLRSPGLIYLAVAVNVLTSFLGVLTLVSYLFRLYAAQTKDLAEHGLWGDSRALPPVMGWTAARNEVDAAAGRSLRSSSLAIPIFWLLHGCSRRLRAGRFIMASSGRSRGLSHGTPGVSHTFAYLYEPLPYSSVWPALSISAVRSAGRIVSRVAFQFRTA